MPEQERICVKKGDKTMTEQMEAPIIVRNKDVEHIVNAAANIGHYAAEVQIDKRFSLLVTSVT